MRSIFVKRSGSSTLRVRVFTARPRATSSARAMLRRGLHPFYVRRVLGFSPERFDRLFGPQALFKW